MFVDERGMFVAQREGRGLGAAIKSVCLVRTAIADGTLTLTAPSMPALHVPIGACLAEARGSERRRIEIPVTIWDDSVSAIDQGEEAEAWATELLSRERPGRYRLVRKPDALHRAAKFGDAEVGFGDAYPFLVISEASLADLNARMPAPLPMNRFRPNIVLAGGSPYQEDQLDRFRIGSIEFHGMTLCLRCPTTATNQDTADRGKEPLRTLATYRKTADGVVFGRNFNHSGSGIVKVGDAASLPRRSPLAGEGGPAPPKPTRGRTRACPAEARFASEGACPTEARFAGEGG
jgi:uncharacterized protein YcbX